MTYGNTGGGRLVGVAADTKPITYPVGTTFYEQDTFLTWTWNGYRWDLSHIPFNSRKKWGGAHMRGGTGFVTSWGNLAGAIQVTPYGTHTIQQDANAIGDRSSTGAVINTISGHRWTRHTQRGVNFYFKYIFKLGQVTATRFFCGMSNANVNPTTTADYLNAVGGIGLWFDDAVAATFKVMHDTGSGASTQDATGITAVAGTVYTLEIVAVDSIPKFQAWLNGVALTDVTTAVISQTGLLGIVSYMENTAAADKFFDSYDLRTYQDG